MGKNRNRGKGEETRGFNLRVPFEGQPEENIRVMAYAFDRQGNFLASARLEKERVSLPLSSEQTSRARIFFGPELPEGREKEEPTLEMMERLKAYEPVWKFNPEIGIQEIMPIPDFHWKYWLLCRCRVRGRVVRSVSVGGTMQQMPVCHARVHICEVDRLPWLIMQLPDDIILRVRDELREALQRPFRWPIPEPDPPPFRFDPGVIDPSPENIAKMNIAALSEPFGGISSRLNSVALNPQPLPPREMAHEMARRAQLLQGGGQAMELGPSMGATMSRMGTASGEFDPQPDPPGLSMLTSLRAETRTALMTSSPTLIRQALVADLNLLRPYFCLWPWFWWWYRCDELAVVETDLQGRFDATIWYWCFGDEPDLYFWVEYFIGGVWTTVYNPPIPCNTYWDYACGDEVILHVNDPRVPVCGDPPDLGGLQVAIMSVGDGVSIPEIQHGPGASEGLTTSGEPFGGILEPHVFFSRSALIAAGITHYRWSYQRLTLADGKDATDSWHNLDRNVIRHYAVIDPTPPDFPLSFVPYPLGPDPAFPAGMDLFQIQPVNPPAGTWAAIDAREDSASAFFQSHLLEGGNAALAAGKYELRFELFRNNGSVVNFTDEGVLLKIPTGPAPFGAGTVPTTIAGPEHRMLDGAGKTVGFRMVLHVDNNPCEAEIYTVTGGGLTVDVNCGFINYAQGSSAQLSFKARHPNNFATFSFTIYRGNSNNVPEASASGSVGADPVNGFARSSASIFTKNVPVNTLLTSNTPPGHTPCDKAAFAENLDVHAMATDGWSTLTYLDRSGLPKAFALEPGP